MATRLPHALPRRPTSSTISTLISPAPTTSTTTTTASIRIAPAAASPTAAACGARRAFSHTPSRAADIIRRPKRPYTFTQVVQLSDGSTFTMRTCAPAGLHRSSKDTRNHIMWQPNDKNLRNVEVDEAGKLAAFRERFGRGFDLDGPAAAAEVEEVEEAGAADAGAAGEKKKETAAAAADDYDAGMDLHDLISGYARPDASIPQNIALAGRKKEDPKKKGGKK